MRRGLAVGVTTLSLLALVLVAALATGSDPAARYATLVRAGLGPLTVIGPFAALVCVSLIGYAVLPRRPATFLILLGLGPLTLIRPYLTVTAGALAIWNGRDPATTVGVVVAVAAVLVVEPYVHRRWYADVAEDTEVRRQ
jgi:hypothetical protein